MRRYSDEAGQVLIGVIALGMVLIITLAVATTALANAVFTTGIATDHTEAQSAAQSADNWVYSWVNSNANVLQSFGQGWLGVNPNNTGAPVSGSPSPQPISSSELPWLQPQPNGVLGNCDTYNQTCVQVQLRYTAPKLQVSSGSQTINEQVLVQVRARTMCHSAKASDNSGCPTWTYQSLIRRRTFLDYLYFTDYETVAPNLYPQAVNAQAVAAPGQPSQSLFPGLTVPSASKMEECTTNPTSGGCLLPVYGGNNPLPGAATDDQVNGPIHTNNSFIAVCGDPSFAPPGGNASLVEVNSELPPPDINRVYLACSGSQPPQNVVLTPPIQFPSGDQQLVNIAATDTNPIDPNGATACAAALATTPPVPQQASGSCGTVFPSGTIIQGNGTQGVVVQTPTATYTYSDPSCAPDTPNCSADPPSTGVIYVLGNASVSGQFKGDWTVAASGSITVGTGPAQNQNNLWLNCQTGGPQQAIPSGCPDMVGLVANNDIILNDSNYSNASAYQDGDAGMAVSAAMMALGYLAPSGSTPPPGYNPCGAYSSTDLPACGSIYSAQWDMAPPSPPATQTDPDPAPYPAPTLTINGAMVSRYRGLFGVYAAGGTAAGAGAGIDYGMIKNFNYDPRFESQQPPWFLQPTASSWAIIGFTQTGATTG